MPNQLTQILDTITPEIFNAYMREITAEQSRFVQSGIAVEDERVSRNITSGGLLVNMPFWNDLDGEDEVLDDGETALTTGKIVASNDIAAVHYRGRGWRVNELAAVTSGDDPLGALMARIAAWWLRREQHLLISTMNGIFAEDGALRPTHFFDASTEGIGPEIILDTKQLLGDASSRLQMLAMHSATHTELQKQNLIKYIPNARGEVNIPTYLDYEVTVDDGIPFDPDTGLYTTYLFGRGSIGRNSGNPDKLTTFESDREAAKGNDALYTRRAVTMHPYGVRWTDAAREEDNITPTNADIATAGNWKLVYEPKNVAITAMQHLLVSPTTTTLSFESFGNPLAETPVETDQLETDQQNSEFSNMTVAELQAALTEQGIEFSSRNTKAELIELLN